MQVVQAIRTLAVKVRLQRGDLSSQCGGAALHCVVTSLGSRALGKAVLVYTSFRSIALFADAFIMERDNSMSKRVSIVKPSCCYFSSASIIFLSNVPMHLAMLRLAQLLLSRVFTYYLLFVIFVFVVVAYRVPRHVRLRVKSCQWMCNCAR